MILRSCYPYYALSLKRFSHSFCDTLLWHSRLNEGTPTEKGPLKGRYLGRRGGLHIVAIQCIHR
jgi:hypothetical protein